MILQNRKIWLGGINVIKVWLKIITSIGSIKLLLLLLLLLPRNIGGDLVLGLGGTGEGAAEGRSARRAAPSRGRGLERGMCPLPI